MSQSNYLAQRHAAALVALRGPSIDPHIEQSLRAVADSMRLIARTAEPRLGTIPRPFK